MQERSSFVVQQNIRRLSGQLRLETDATRRVRLQRFLVEEEDRLGFTVERLEDLDLAIADGDKRVEFQRAKIGNLENCGCDVMAARAVLRNMEEIQSIYRQYRLMLLQAIDRDGVVNGD
jgi:DNA repair ATPase RecN